MSESQAASYRTAVQAAHQAAEEELTNRLMKDIRREESAGWKALRDPIRSDVEAQVNSERTYKALALLEAGTRPDGSPLAEGTTSFKLNREDVKHIFGQDLYKHCRVESPRRTVCTRNSLPTCSALRAPENSSTLSPPLPNARR